MNSKSNLSRNSDAYIPRQPYNVEYGSIDWYRSFVWWLQERRLCNSRTEEEEERKWKGKWARLARGMKKTDISTRQCVSTIGNRKFKGKEARDFLIRRSIFWYRMSRQPRRGRIIISFATSKHFDTCVKVIRVKNHSRGRVGEEE